MLNPAFRPVSGDDSRLAGHLKQLPLERLQSSFAARAEFVVIDNCVPREILEPLIENAHALRSRAHRNYIPGHKKGGSISAFQLAEWAPPFGALYGSAALLATLETLTRRPLLRCPDNDPHAYALYYYTEPGDHIGYHYDTSYYRGDRYTALLGLIDNSSCRLECQLYRNTPARETELVSINLAPGRLVWFNGDKLYHRITPLEPGEQRVALTLEYLTSTGINSARRFVSNMKDAIAYFGFKQIFGGRGP